MGTYEDQRDLLLFYRDREIELRNAITNSDMVEMRALPGVTNAIPFRSKHFSAMMAMLNSWQFRVSMQNDGKGLLGRAAETEARRRIVIAAIALRAGTGWPTDRIPEICRRWPRRN